MLSEMGQEERRAWEKDILYFAQAMCAGLVWREVRFQCEPMGAWHLQAQVTRGTEQAQITLAYQRVTRTGVLLIAAHLVLEARRLLCNDHATPRASPHHGLESTEQE
jgi:hypothetical protein